MSDYSDYFHSYADSDVHETMLRDEIRNESYRAAIFQNRSRINDKVVMDLGSGTGFLAILCAKVGARKVYAIEPTVISKLLKEIVNENNCNNVIKVITKKIENVKLNEDCEKVDVIVCEWMGHYLVHEAMLDSVIYARDKFLKSGGLIFPEIAKLYVAPCSAPSFFDYWNNVSEVSMQAVGKIIRNNLNDKPRIKEVNESDLIADEELIAWIDLKEIDNIDQFKIDYLKPLKNLGRFQGVCIWFDCDFPSEDINNVITLSTSPKSALTHWKQTLIVLPTELDIVEKGYPIAFKLSLTRDETFRRFYNISLELVDPNEVDHPEPCQCYFTKCILLSKLLEDHEDN